MKCSAFCRVRPPKDDGSGYVPPPERTRVESFGRVHDPRLPMPGTVLTREYRGQRLRVTVLASGFEYEGRVFRSLSAVARDVTGATWNGYLFFGLTTGQKNAGAAL